MTESELSNAPVSEDIRSRVLDIVVREGMIDRDTLVGTATLDDVGVQSIDMVIIIQAIEEEFDIYIPLETTLTDVRDVDGLVDAIVSLVENPISPPTTTPSPVGQAQ